MSPPRSSPPSLRRRRATRDPGLKLVILCEGKNSEPDYLNEFIAEHPSPLISVEVIGAAGVPKTLVDKARDRLRKLLADKGNNNPNDRVWVVFDCDEHPRVKEALEEARRHGIGVAYSDPCFELWGLLHKRDFDALLDRHKLQAEFADCIEGYDRRRGKRISYHELKDGYAAACTRAERLRERRLRDGGTSPYTDVDLLTKFIEANTGPR